MQQLTMFLVLFFLSLQLQAQQVTTGTVPEFERAVQNGAVQVLDVRRAEEFRSGHLQGAFQADWLNKKEFAERTKHLDKQRPLYVYCYSGVRSEAAGTWLAENGFISVIHLKGGILAWTNAGKPVEGASDEKQMTVAEYEKETGSAPLVLVDFSAGWCPPCKKMEPVLQAFRKAHPEVKVVTIDAGQHRDLAKRKGAEALPLFLVYRKGVETSRIEGVTSLEALTAAVKGGK